ncbi:MAG TPA: hypothetical protein DCM45_01845, partial [Clostridiales bacterium]|nr:hypothetical protein [Clostridiales bacterium]
MKANQPPVRRNTLINKIWHDLTRRLLLVICITVIPINILAVLVSSLVLIEARDRQAQALQSDFTAFMNRKDALINELDNWTAEFIVEQILVLSLRDGASSVLSIGMTQELGRVINGYGIKGFAYLLEKQDDQRLMVKGNKNHYTFLDLEYLKLSLTAEQPELQNSQDWHIRYLGDRYYLCRIYSYLNYNIGIGIDIAAEFNIWPDGMPVSDSTVLLTDGQTILIHSQTDNWQLINAGQKDQLVAGGGLTDTITSWQSRRTRGQLSTWLIDRQSWSNVPVYYWILLVFAFISLAAIFALWHLVGRQVIRPLKILQQSMRSLKNSIQQHRIEEVAETRDFEYIFQTFNTMADEIMQAHEQELLMVQTEIVNLRLQVNPHLLLNSLNIIHSLAQSKNYSRIQEFTRSLANYFQYVLRENNRLVPLETEMKFVDSYINIQKTRYPDEFISRTSISDDAAKALVPPLLIENFVENAMKYARRADRPVEVSIIAIRDNDNLVVT